MLYYTGNFLVRHLKCTCIVWEADLPHILVFCQNLAKTFVFRSTGFERFAAAAAATDVNKTQLMWLTQLCSVCSCAFGPNWQLLASEREFCACVFTDWLWWRQTLWRHLRWVQSTRTWRAPFVVVTSSTRIPWHFACTLVSKYKFILFQTVLRSIL